MSHLRLNPHRAPSLCLTKRPKMYTIYIMILGRARVTVLAIVLAALCAGLFAGCVSRQDRLDREHVESKSVTSDSKDDTSTGVRGFFNRLRGDKPAAKASSPETTMAPDGEDGVARDTGGRWRFPRINFKAPGFIEQIGERYTFDSVPTIIVISAVLSVAVLCAVIISGILI